MLFSLIPNQNDKHKGRKKFFTLRKNRNKKKTEIVKTDKEQLMKQAVKDMEKKN